MRIFTTLLACTILLTTLSISAQSGEYKPNFFSSHLPVDGTYANSTDSNDFQVFTQLSFKKMIHPISVNDIDLADFGMAFTGRAVGKTNEESAPFTGTFEPELFLQRTITPDLDLRYGWMHGSTGESDDESESWNLHNLTADFLIAFGDVMIEAHPSVWWAFNVGSTSLDLVDQGKSEGVRAWKGRMGVGIWGTLHWGEDVRIPFEWEKNGIEAALEVDLFDAYDNDIFVRLGYWNGRQIVMQDPFYSEAFNAGIGMDL